MLLSSQFCGSAFFSVDLDPPAVGIKNGSKSARGDFSIELKSLVEAESNTGYLASVTRAVDRKKGQVIRYKTTLMQPT